MGQLILVRHGQASFGAEDYDQLSDLGKRQGYRLGEYWREASHSTERSDALDFDAVLIGSQSFWEGVDVRGDALSVVIIDKLPFAPPDDPVLAARIAEMEKRGLNGFMHHQLPEAIINLKQGAGRLIRDEADRGVLVICDPRLISKPYGKRIWQSLPPFARTRELSAVQAFLDGNEPLA